MMGFMLCTPIHSNKIAPAIDRISIQNPFAIKVSPPKDKEINTKEALTLPAALNRHFLGP
ncbi:hypothetical protein GCM10007392_03330 [Saccharospirillum salsuginis]|uniref:Uncharacterized protein n=1 Tax=Saccharospirillum salsuginis TaxID=418750 RepID=A0A918JZJ1_9GAMM|nr:hypothetical protein GCM10007392_03330 [Saccharospirillum salsuginis]